MGNMHHGLIIKSKQDVSGAFEGTDVTGGMCIRLHEKWDGSLPLRHFGALPIPVPPQVQILIKAPGSNFLPTALEQSKYQIFSMGTQSPGAAVASAQQTGILWWPLCPNSLPGHKMRDGNAVPLHGRHRLQGLCEGLEKCWKASLLIGSVMRMSLESVSRLSGTRPGCCLALQYSLLSLGGPSHPPSHLPLDLDAARWEQPGFLPARIISRTIPDSDKWSVPWCHFRVISVLKSELAKICRTCLCTLLCSG